ncbi:hypothetical protein TVAG_499800 [Trichomonas vaginalis G3]|uniref:Uncharacterized protein n=1 Tax=Trichomonas vaginalis (strain ATCC PRA-98 / G3) TaxID=412133 RepID=A2EIR5_TRIV3|nr:armadillo (ARM) repeat-containing protein family [Trichomonas vaginalis G3]EAY07492.1 hypothetical protein TVAG_499800 [Trichomonas vaginalis G3]KAI5487812.1 armadillo (ARM) repeat-containing protein family [Trichomonas vaginalis G3]|eukprot:XP_001319715.1 hypothetical protein [Trichomonas vaginalis G3]
MDSFKNIHKEETTGETEKQVIFNENSMSFLLSSIDANEIDQDTFKCIENQIIQLNIQLKHAKIITEIDIQRYEIPLTFFKIFMKFSDSIMIDSLIYLLETLSKLMEFPFQMMEEIGIDRFMIEYLDSQKCLDNTSIFINKTKIITIFTNNMIHNTSISTDLISIGLFHSLQNVFEELSNITIDQASVTYLESLANAVFICFEQILIDPLSHEGFILFIKKWIDVENQFLQEGLTELIFRALTLKINLSELFVEPNLIKLLVDAAIQNEDINAINVLSEFTLYGEINKDLIPNILEFCNNINVNEFLEKAKAEINSNKNPSEILTLCGNILYILDNVPDEINPTIVTEILELANEKCDLKTKISATFLQVSLWSKIDPILFGAIASPDLLSICFDVAFNTSPQLHMIIINLLDNLLSKYQSINMLDVVSHEIFDFLEKSIEEGNEEISDKAAVIMETYFPVEPQSA